MGSSSEPSRAGCGARQPYWRQVTGKDAIAIIVPGPIDFGVCPLLHIQEPSVLGNRECSDAGVNAPVRLNVNDRRIRSVRVA